MMDGWTFMYNYYTLHSQKHLNTSIEKCLLTLLTLTFQPLQPLHCFNMCDNHSSLLWLRTVFNKLIYMYLVNSQVFFLHFQMKTIVFNSAKSILYQN